MAKRYRKKCCCGACRLPPRCLGLDYGAGPEGEDIWPALAEYLGVTTVENVRTVDWKVTAAIPALSVSGTAAWWRQQVGPSTYLTADATFSASLPSRTAVARPRSLFTGCDANSYAFYGRGLRSDGATGEIQYGGLTPSWSIALDAPPSSWTESDGTGDTAQYETRNFASSNSTPPYFSGLTMLRFGYHNLNTTLTSTYLDFTLSVGFRFQVAWQYEYRVRTPTGTYGPPWYAWSDWIVEEGYIELDAIFDPVSDTLTIDRNDAGPQSTTVSLGSTTWEINNPRVPYPSAPGRNLASGSTSMQVGTLTPGDVTVTLDANDEADPQLLAAPRLMVQDPNNAGPIQYRQVCADSGVCIVALDRYWERVTPGGVETLERIEVGAWNTPLGVGSVSVADELVIFGGYEGSDTSPVATSVYEESGTPITSIDADTSTPQCPDCAGTITVTLTGTHAGVYTLTQTSDDCIWTGSSGGIDVTLDTIESGAKWRIFADGGVDISEWRAVRTCACAPRRAWTAESGTTGTARTS